MFISKLPHSYYFTTRILFLKFVNKGVFFEEIQDSHFPRKREYFGTHLGDKGVIFDVQCFTVKRGIHLGWKVSVLLQKRGSVWTEKSVLSRQRGYFWWPVFYREKGSSFRLESQCLAVKKEVIFKLEHKDGYHFFQWVREPWFILHAYGHCLYMCVIWAGQIPWQCSQVVQLTFYSSGNITYHKHRTLSHISR